MNSGAGRSIVRRSNDNGITIELMDVNGPKSNEACTAVLEKIVDDLNELDDPIGFVETVEREELVLRIEELASLVGLDNQTEKLTSHRDW